MKGRDNAYSQNTMNKFIIAGTIAALSVFVIAGSVSAAGPGASGFGKGITQGSAGYERMISEKAALLGISVDALKSKIAEGKNFLTIANELGVSQETLQSRMRAAYQERLQKMVDAGLISAAEMQERLDLQKQRQESCANGTIGSGRAFSRNGKNFRGMGLMSGLPR